MYINAQVLHAAAKCAATKDVRYYLNGILVEFDSGKAIVVGSDGHILFAGHATPTENESKGSIIIPIDAVKKCPKSGAVRLEPIDDTQWNLAGTLFTPIDGKFLDYRRVIPQASDVSSAAQEVTMYNPDVLVRARDALKLYTGESKPVMYPLAQRGNDASVMHTGDNRAVVVITPLRNDADIYSAKYQGFAD